MNMQDNLRRLAASEAPAAPFGFDEFMQRSALKRVRQRATQLSAIGSVAALGVVSIMALVTQAPPQLQGVGVVPPQSAVVETEELPALVNMDQFDVTTELQDHIAVLDAELSAARGQAAPTEQLRQLESARQQLNQSLQRVSYAHSLLSL